MKKKNAIHISARYEAIAVDKPEVQVCTDKKIVCYRCRREVRVVCVYVCVNL